MSGADAGVTGDRPHPTVRGAPIEPLPVTATQDRTLGTFPHGEIDGARRPRDQRDHGRLVALAEDPEGAVTALEPEVLDVGPTRLTHAQPVETQQHRQGGVVMVVALRGEQERRELGAVEASRVGRMDLGAAHVLRGVRRDVAIDVREPVEATHRRQPPVDRRGRETLLLEPASV
jgi:hypothetical protein